MVAGAAGSGSQQRFLRSFAAELMLRDPDGAQLDRVDDPLARGTSQPVVAAAEGWARSLAA